MYVVTQTIQRIAPYLFPAVSVTSVTSSSSSTSSKFLASPPTTKLQLTLFSFPHYHIECPQQLFHYHLDSMHSDSLLSNRPSCSSLHTNYTAGHQCPYEQQHKLGQFEGWFSGNFRWNNYVCFHEFFHVQSYHSWRRWSHDSGCPRINLGRKWTGILGWTRI